MGLESFYSQKRKTCSAEELSGMFSAFPDGGVPKYVWAVDNDGEAYESKVIPGSFGYKGYRLEEEDAMRNVVLKEWAKR
jgi:hypothetical protein